MINKSFRRLGLSRRSLLIVAAILAIPTIWFGWQWRIVQQRSAVMDMMWQRNEWLDGMEIFVPMDQWPRLPWYRRLLGDSTVPSFYLDGEAFSSDEISLIKETFPEIQIRIAQDYGIYPPGKTPGPLPDFPEAIRVRARLAETHYNKALTYGAKRDYGGEIAEESEAIRLKPDYAKAFYVRGLTFGLKGDIDKAIADCTEAIRLDPKMAAAYSTRGSAYLIKRDYDKAIADYSDAIRLDPKVAAVYQSRAVAYSKLGEASKAEADFAEAKRLGH